MTIDDIMERVSTFIALDDIPGYGADAEADVHTAIQTALDEARAEERERCAKMCDSWSKQNWVYVNGAIQCAAAIRKGETE